MNLDQQPLTVNETGGDWAAEWLCSNFVHTQILPGISTSCGLYKVLINALEESATKGRDLN